MLTAQSKGTMAQFLVLFHALMTGTVDPRISGPQLSEGSDYPDIAYLHILLVSPLCNATC